VASFSAVNGPVKNTRKGGSCEIYRFSVAGDWLSWELKWANEAWGAQTHYSGPERGSSWIMCGWMRLSVGSKDHWAVGHHDTATRASEEKYWWERKENKKEGKNGKGCVIVATSHMVLADSHDLSTPYLI